MNEFLKYEDLLLSKTKRTKEQFIEIMHVLKEIITIVPQEEYSRFTAEAEKTSPDKKDVAYFALAKPQSKKIIYFYHYARPNRIN